MVELSVLKFEREGYFCCAMAPHEVGSGQGKSNRRYKYYDDRGKMLLLSGIGIMHITNSENRREGDKVWSAAKKMFLLGRKFVC